MKLLRSIVSVILSLSILLSIGGVSIYKHYCGDYLVSYSFFSPADDCAGEEDDSCEKKKSKCCHDQMEYYSADVDVVKHEQQSFQFAPNFFTLAEMGVEETVLPVPTSCVTTPSPPIHAPPIYLLQSQLTYYG